MGGIGHPNCATVANVRVVVGPVDIASASAWLSYAREVVDDLAFAESDECYAGPEVLAVFRHYIESWEAEAAQGEKFLWEQEIPVEVLEYHVHAFKKVVEVLAAREARSGISHAPEESDVFYKALIQGIVVALAAEGPASAEFAVQLEETWPGL